MTDVTTQTLAGFLLARIAEDEDRADAIHDRFGCDLHPLATYGACSCRQPARVRAQCEVRRWIVEQCVARGSQRQQIRPGVYANALRILAEPHAGHPDFLDEWRA